jgi:hypothetical protein
LRQAAVPVDRAFLLQGIGGAGEIVFTGYQWTTSDIPQLPDMISTERVTAEGAGHLRRRRAVHTVGTVGAVALIGSAGGACGVSLVVRDRMSGETTSAGDLDGLRDRANAAATTGAVLGAAAAGVGLATWAIPW